jgi:hypothetical protein
MLYRRVYGQKMENKGIQRVKGYSNSNGNGKSVMIILAFVIAVSISNVMVPVLVPVPVMATAEELVAGEVLIFSDDFNDFVCNPSTIPCICLASIVLWCRII